MTIINASPDRTIQIGYEGEDNVTKIIFRYDSEWLSHGSGTFSIRVLRHGEKEAYNAVKVSDNRDNATLEMTVTNVELSVNGAGEMQVVYSGSDFVKKSPIYSYNVSRAVDEAVDPPAQDVYTEIIENLSGLGEDIGDIQTDIRQMESSIGALSALTTAKIGDLSALTTETKTDLVSAINEVNAKEGGTVTVDDALSTTSTNPVQNKVITARIAALAIDIEADVLDLETNKADKSYVDTQLSTKASTATATASSDGLMSAQDKSRLDAVYADYTSALTALGGGS